MQDKFFSKRIYRNYFKSPSLVLFFSIKSCHISDVVCMLYSINFTSPTKICHKDYFSWCLSLSLLFSLFLSFSLFFSLNPCLFKTLSTLYMYIKLTLLFFADLISLSFCLVHAYLSISHLLPRSFPQSYYLRHLSVCICICLSISQNSFRLSSDSRWWKMGEY